MVQTFVKYSSVLNSIDFKVLSLIFHVFLLTFKRSKQISHFLKIDWLIKNFKNTKSTMLFRKIVRNTNLEEIPSST